LVGERETVGNFGVRHLGMTVSANPEHYGERAEEALLLGWANSNPPGMKCRFASYGSFVVDEQSNHAAARTMKLKYPMK
jgi:hypothetical protein